VPTPSSSPRRSPAAGGQLKCSRAQRRHVGRPRGQGFEEGIRESVGKWRVTENGVPAKMMKLVALKIAIAVGGLATGSRRRWR